MRNQANPSIQWRKFMQDDDKTKPVPDGDAADGNATNVKEPSQAQLDADRAANKDTGEGDGANESSVDQAG